MKHNVMYFSLLFCVYTYVLRLLSHHVTCIVISKRNCRFSKGNLRDSQMRGLMDRTRGELILSCVTEIYFFP